MKIQWGLEPPNFPLGTPVLSGYKMLNFNYSAFHPPGSVNVLTVHTSSSHLDPSPCLVKYLLHIAPQML